MTSARDVLVDLFNEIEYERTREDLRLLFRGRRDDALLWCRRLVERRIKDLDERC